jgi:hypothetical protein
MKHVSRTVTGVFLTLAACAAIGAGSADPRPVWRGARAQSAEGSKGIAEVTDIRAPGDNWVCTGAAGSIDGNGNFRFFWLKFTEIRNGAWGKSQWVKQVGKDSGADATRLPPEAKVELPEGWAATGIGLAEHDSNLRTIVLKASRFDPKFNRLGREMQEFSHNRERNRKPEVLVYTRDELLVGISMVGTNDERVHTLEVKLAQAIDRRPRDQAAEPPLRPRR